MNSILQHGLTQEEEEEDEEGDEDEDEDREDSQHVSHPATWSDTGG